MADREDEDMKTHTEDRRQKTEDKSVEEEEKEEETLQLYHAETIHNITLSIVFISKR